MKHLLGLILMALLGGLCGCLLAHRHNLPDNRVPIAAPEVCKDLDLRWRYPGAPPEGRVRCI